MVQFECPRVIHSLVSLIFGVHSVVSILLYAEKGKCCMWPVNKVEFILQKLASSLANDPIWMTQAYGMSLFPDCRKRKCCTWPVKKVEIRVAKIGFLGCKRSNLNTPGTYTQFCHNSYSITPSILTEMERTMRAASELSVPTAPFDSRTVPVLPHPVTFD